MRSFGVIFGFAALVAAQGCVALEAIAPKCTQEQIIVTWPVTITRGSSVTTPLLTYTLTQNNIDRAQFDALRAALTGGGGAGTYKVTWSIPAFEINGGYIALTHTAPLASGETRQVGSAFQGGGWGAQEAAATQPAISLRADNFVATAATGSITALASSPLRLRIDITTASSAGETIRVAGDAGFFYDSVIALCN